MGLFSLMHGSRGAKRFNAWQIEITTRCPLKCRMCVKEVCADWLRQDMAVADFERIAPYLKAVQSVVLEGWGESLMHPRLNDFIRLAKAQGPEVGFVTSGYGLDEERSRELIDLGIDFIGFSFSGATAAVHNRIRIHSDFVDLLRSVSTFLELARACRTGSPKVHIVYLLLKENITELPGIVNMARSLGIKDVVAINNAQVTTAWQDEQRVFSCGHESTYKMIAHEALKRAKKLKVKLTLPGLAPLDVPVCSENPLENLYISAGGDVSPCVYLQPPIPSPFPRIYCGEATLTDKVTFGNILREDLEAIWQGPVYRAFRGAFEDRRRCWRDTVEALTDMRLAGVRPMPEPPPGCRTCHKMLGF